MRALVKDCGCETVKVWEEPLRNEHIAPAISALLWPRDEKHLNTSILFRVFDLGLRVMMRIVPKMWNNIPFIKGHTIMLVAAKTADAGEA